MPTTKLAAGPGNRAVSLTIMSEQRSIFCLEGGIGIFVVAAGWSGCVAKEVDLAERSSTRQSEYRGL